MSPRLLSKHRYAILFTIFVIVICVLAVVFAFNYGKIYTQNTAIVPIPSTQPKTATLSGEVVCLPHADTSGPQTLECAIGLHDLNGNYYALDTNKMDLTPPPFSTGDKIKVTGVLTPVEYLSTDFWKKYNIVGIFSVENITAN